MIHFRQVPSGGSAFPRSLAQPKPPLRYKNDPPLGRFPAALLYKTIKRSPQRVPGRYSSFGLFLQRARKGPRLFHTSVYMRVPTKTKAVPSQCQAVKGLRK